MALLQFMDFEAKDFTTIYPDIKPGIGGVWFARWDQWEPNQGQYNVNLVRNWLAAESKNRLQDGSPKPLICFLLVHTAPDNEDAQGVDYSPAWVKAVCPSLTATASNGTTALMPAYNNLQWWGYLSNAVKAFALETDGKAQIICVSIGHGCDGELWPMKSPWNAKLPSGVEKVFGEQTIKLLDVYRQAYSKTPLAVRATPGSGRKAFVQAAIARNIGYHFCGMQVAAQNAHGWGNEYGTMDGLRDAHAAGLPALAETTFGMGNQEAAYWSILGMLALKVDAMDVHPEWLSKVLAGFWTWAIQHMGKSADKAPTAWIALRDYDSKYAPIQWTGSNGVVSGQSDWPGDYDYYLKRTSPDSDAPRYEDVGPADAPESRQCRRVTEAMFKVNPDFPGPPYRLSVTWLQEPGKVLSVNGVPVSNSGNGLWMVCSMTLDDRQFTLTGNGAAVHMLIITPTAEPEPPEPPDQDVDAEAILAAADLAREAIESAAEAVERASEAVGVASSQISVAATALQEAVNQQDATVQAQIEATRALEAAMAQLDTITKEASATE